MTVEQQSRMTQIRVADNRDRDDIREVYLRAFSDGENRMVSALATKLLDEESNPEIIALVAEADDAVVGHIAFSPVTINDNQRWCGYILAPLGVEPEYQNRQLGAKLIASGMRRLSDMGVNVVFVYGDPNYYGRFGFTAEAASGYLPAYELQYPFGWQARSLNGGVATRTTVTISCVAPLSDPALW